MNYSRTDTTPTPLPIRNSPASVPARRKGESLTPGNLAFVKLAKDLRAATTTCESKQELVALFLEIAIGRSPLLLAQWLESTAGQAPDILESRCSNPTVDNGHVRNQIIESAILAIDSQKVQMAAPAKLRGATIICIPFYSDDNTVAVLGGLVHTSEQNCSEGLLVCQIIANHFDLWRARKELTALAIEVRSAATVLELVGKVQTTRSTREACYKIANELKEHFRCDYVAIGLSGESSHGCKLMAVSATAEFDSESKSTLLFRSAFDEATMRSGYTVYPPRTPDQRNAALGHKKLASHLRVDSVITVPLRDSSQKILGALTFAGNRQLDGNIATRNLIAALDEPIGLSVDLVRFAEGGVIRRLGRKLFSGKTNLLWATWAVVLIAVIAMFVPVSYRIHCTCTAEPVVRRVCVAPYEGLLESTFVQPGDLVTKDQLLARMDAREIRFQRAGVEAEKTRAIKTRNTHQANREIPDALLADLERARLEQESQLLKYREQNFEIVSPVAGIVLTGSLDRRENYPVTIGQALFEVGPLDPLRIELAIPADEIMHVEVGQKVLIRFDGFGTKSVEGRIDRIRPSTVIRDDRNVFIAEAILQNPEGVVRPGMNGHARVFGAKHRLGWTIFHRPWEKIVTAIGF